MRKQFINFTGILALFVFLSIGCSSAKETAKEQEPTRRRLAAFQEDAQNLPLAPDFQLQDLNQDTYTLGSYKDKQQPVILFFWTTWCPYCREELKVLREKYSQLVVDGWELFAVNVGESANRVDGFVKSYSLPFKVLLDKTTSVAKSFEILGVPTYVFVDKNGNIISVEHFFPQEKYKDLTQAGKLNPL